MCEEDAYNQLGDTRFTQPCLFVVNALHYFKALQQGGAPDIVAGHSLGEYNALLAAGAFDFATGVRLVKRRGELMGSTHGGGMAAVLGLSQHDILRVIADHSLTEINLANFNSPRQFVLSGNRGVIEKAEKLFVGAGATLYYVLPVSAAFHSRQMLSAADQFRIWLRQFEFNKLMIPVVSNITGSPYPEGDTSKILSDYLTRQITEPVQWIRTVRYLLSSGVSEISELGPGNVLTRLIGQIKADAG
jgi:malonyl CoA-acyl carrier protein transacylase